MVYLLGLRIQLQAELPAGLPGGADDAAAFADGARQGLPALALVFVS